MDHLWIQENSSFPASPIFKVTHVLHDHHWHYQGWLQPFDDLRYHLCMVYLPIFVWIWQCSCDLSADQVTLGSTGFFTTLFLLAQSTKPTPETHAQLCSNKSRRCNQQTSWWWHGDWCQQKQVIEVVQMMNKHISTMLEQYSIYTFGPQNPWKMQVLGP